MYTGITTEIERRVKEHNGEFSGGAKYTRTRQPVVLVYYKEFPSRAEASKEEFRIKQLTKKEKQKLISAKTC